MGQKAPTRRAPDGALDLVITNALLIDHWGIVKGDIGIRDTELSRWGTAGNPDTMEGVDPELVVGASTEVIAGENLISLPPAASIVTSISSLRSKFTRRSSNGITTMIGGGTGPATGTSVHLFTGSMEPDADALKPPTLGP